MTQSMRLYIYITSIVLILDKSIISRVNGESM